MPPGVHTTTRRPKAALPKNSQLLNIWGSIWHRIWKTWDSIFRWKLKAPSKALVCPWVKQSLLAHHLLSFGCQESDQQGCPPFLFPYPVRNPFPSPITLFSWSPSVPVLSDWALETWLVWLRNHIVFYFVLLYLHLKTDTWVNSWKTSKHPWSNVDMRTYYFLL